MTEGEASGHAKKHHLTPKMEANKWKPGQSGNPGGRKKDPGITPVQIEMMDKVCSFDSQGRTWREWLAEKGLLQVANSPRAVKDYKDRVEGPTIGDEENPIFIKLLERLRGTDK